RGGGAPVRGAGARGVRPARRGRGGPLMPTPGDDPTTESRDALAKAAEFAQLGPTGGAGPGPTPTALRSVPVPVAARLGRRAPPPVPAPAEPAGLLARLIGFTVVGLARCLGSVWYAERHRPAGADGAGGRLVHKGTLALDRRSAVHLIEVDRQMVAVTTGATG